MTSPLPGLDDSELESRLAADLDEIERRLVEAARHSESIVDETSRHLLAAGGKRIRPVLVLLTSQFGDGVNEQVLQAAVATELTHLATLYHDDVMDSAPMRRGAPSAHELWGNSVAILTGDLLFARASRLVSDLGPIAVRVQAEAFERLVMGQLHETLGPGEGGDPIAHYLQVLADKTGSLIAAAACYGTMLSGAAESAQEAVISYGEKVGVAFQLADDVIDLISDAETTGKTPGTDLREGVATMPVLLLRARAAAGTLDAEGEQLLADLDGDLSTDEAVADVLARLRVHDVLDEAREMARRWSSDAIAELAPLPESAARDALEVFAGLLVDRMA
ncbi:polyprenyl synthetase family protein [Ruania halotolerans]|uniref:polyprenyl synthetase family protein n=1 Tax=Ruania halotolerans TaxID=2897773 RepID=UPI001E2B712B|nr:polyprenyl synthetase family protein [Ruania halotolerans]UFU05794.1 polyprenyl synthetase family protein [Ruania halotolerans]